MRRLKAVLRELARDGKCPSAAAVGRAAGVAKTGWLEYLNGRRPLPRKDKRGVVGHVRDVLGIATPWPELEAIVDDDDETAKAKTTGERCRESNGSAHNAPGDEQNGDERRRLMLTRVVREHFGLTRDPFGQEVGDIDGVFLGPVHRQVLNTMLDAAKFGKFAALIAEIGWGKTILRKYMVERLRERGCHICIVEQLDRENLTAGRIMDALLADLAGRRGSSTMSREAKTREIKSMLTSMHDQDKAVVLMIDEAHALHPSTLRALKRLYEIEDGLHKLLSIVLFGQPQMYSRLGGHDLEEVSQRLDVVMAYGLDSLAIQGAAGPERPKPRGKSCVPDYLRHLLEHAGARNPEKVIAADAMKLIATTTDVPLRINSLATRALNLAHQLGYATVTRDVVEQLSAPREG